MKEHILDVIKKYWGGALNDNITRFMSFNLGYPDIKDNTYLQQITDFNAELFNQQIDVRLSGKAPESADERMAFIRRYSNWITPLII